MRLTRLLLPHTNTVPADESLCAVTAEWTFCVGANLIQTVTGQHPVATFIHIWAREREKRRHVIQSRHHRPNMGNAPAAQNACLIMNFFTIYIFVYNYLNTWTLWIYNLRHTSCNELLHFPYTPHRPGRSLRKDWTVLSFFLSRPESTIQVILVFVFFVFLGGMLSQANCRYCSVVTLILDRTVYMVNLAVGSLRFQLWNLAHPSFKSVFNQS